MTHSTIAMQEKPIGAAPPRGYQYKHGDRPLDGFTIQRGAGRGGFGEVYYALSDSGREVALKLITTYEQIELRGISQCMNLKSPHLVTIFDVKYGQDGRPWVIMEYVSGPSLRELLDSAPSGLGTQKAAFFLREIGKGLTYLHDCGIVHRDLKPGNIFYENGYVKIGDYGLSKAISTTQHSGQTVTVGTVHYMAPEVGAGKYDKSIDIYAMGALLFELLTGQVPFFGASPAEILMKHLSAQPDLTNIEEPFAGVIRKAMAKDPAERYQTVQEMVEAVFGSEHVRNSVSCFSPDSLSMVAGRAVREGGTGSAGEFTPSDGPTPAAPCDRWMRMGQFVDRCGARLARAGMPQFGHDAGRGTVEAIPSDPLPLRHKVILAIATIVLGGAIAGAIGESPVHAFFVLFAVTGATLGAIGGRHLALPALRHGELWFAQLIVGGIATLAAVLAVIPLVASAGPDELRRPGGTMLALVVGLLLMGWWARLGPDRKDRVSGGKLFSSALLGLIVAAIFQGSPLLVIAVLLFTTIAVGIVSPWQVRRGNAFPVIPMGARPQPMAAAQQGAAAPRPVVAMPPAQAQPIQPVPLPPVIAGLRPVRKWARAIFLSLFVGLASLGLMLWTAMVTLASDDLDRALFFAFGTGALLAAGFCLKRSFRAVFGGWWEYLFRPALQFACIQSILVSMSMAASGRLESSDMPGVIFFTVFPAILWFVITFLVGRGGPPMTQAMNLSSSPGFAPPGEPISLTRIALGTIRLVCTLVGLLVLTYSLLMTLAVVTDLPGLFASGTLDPRMPQDMREAFGFDGWPHLLRQLGAIVAVITGLIATGLLVLPRRRVGAIHMMRAVAGVVVLFAAIVALGHALPDWADVDVVKNNPGGTIDLYLQMVRMHGVVGSGLLMIAGVFLLLWPPRRKSAAAVQFVPAFAQQQQQQQQAV